MKRLAVLLVVTFVVIAGCSASPPAAQESGTETTTGGDGTDDGTEETGEPDDPDADVIGWEGGYWHNESIDVNQSDGLSDAETDAYVSRAMARVEHLRQLEFEEDVEVEAITREEHRQRTAGQSDETAAHAAWNNQVWEALFIVDENTNASDEFDALLGSNVLGYYAPSTDELVVISDDPDEAVIDNATLVHELTHALQDQHFDLEKPKYQPETQDTQLSTNGLTEGEANYIEARYSERCASGEWECVETPGRNPGGGDVNLGVFLTVFQPYSDGPVYVSELVEAGGWDAVAEAHASPPQSSEQVIYPGIDERPAGIEVARTAENGWERFDEGADGADTVGEASLYAMFWYQAVNYDVPVINPNGLTGTEAEYDTYNYTSVPSAGWGDDAVVPYRNGDEFGYVWKTKWDTERDAREFHEAYLTVLEGHGAEQRGENTWVIPDGGFADAFHVAHDGDTVRIVNAPEVEDLADLRPDVSPPQNATA